MNKERNPIFEPTSIERLSHNIVSNWVESANITLRPADKAALKKMISRSIPVFFEENQTLFCERYLDSVKETERKACIDAIATLDEPISGLINKQRTLNACTYSEAAKDIPSS